IVPECSGALQAESPDELGALAVNNMRINQRGYLYIYVNNASIHTVLFDNLYISHTSSKLLDESNYYPFGMLWGIPNSTTPANNYRYNGKELQKELGLFNEDYGARHYDPTISKWNQMDPLCQQYWRWSPYN